MEARSDVVISGEFAALLESPYDLIAVLKICHVVAALSVSFQRQELTVYAEAADSVVGTELQRCLQCVGVRHAQPGQLRQCSITIHAADSFDRGGAELDGLVAEDAAQAQAD